MSESQLAELTDHVTALRAEMKMRLLDAFIVPRFDAHQGEYIAPHDERLGFVTGFTGSAGVAIVTQSEVRLFVDGRYVVQAGNQCPAGLIDRDHIHNHPPEHWLSDVAQPDWVIGYDAMHLPPNWVKRFEKGANAAGASLKAMSENPVDAVWGDQPDEPLGTISAFPLQFAGVSSSDKRDLFLKEMAAEDAALLVETQPDNIAWFLNVRGDDVAYNPMPQSFLLLERSGAAGSPPENTAVEKHFLRMMRLPALPFRNGNGGFHGHNHTAQTHLGLVLL
jgi:Xaa-Pro aminopeptidase